MDFFRKNRKIAELSGCSFLEVKKRARIVVIDDDKNSFPIELLKKEGYQIDYWEDIEDLSKLDDGYYDIIFLDISGVGLEYSKEEGCGILEHIKKTNPCQIVVAFSGQSFDLSKNRFWEMADDSLPKPVDATRCKEVIDVLLKTKMNPTSYWMTVAEILKAEGVSNKNLAKVENDVFKAITNNANKSEIANIFKKVCQNMNLVTSLVSAVAKIIALVG